jgi:lysophospholipase L1-like esterase
VILAFGDSLTYGTGVHADTESYPAMLEQLMGIQVVNAGVPGEVSSQARQRLKRVLNTYEPDLVILCHGGNDIIQKLSKEELKSNLIAMITEIRQSGAQVVMLAVPSLGFMVSPDPLYKQVAKEQHIVFDNDTIAELEAKPVLKSDPIHFNEAGYTLLAERIHSLLQQHGAI